MNYDQLNQLMNTDPEKANNYLLGLKASIHRQQDYLEFRKLLTMDCIKKNINNGGLKRNPDGSYEKTELWEDCVLEEVKDVMDGGTGKPINEIDNNLAVII